MTYLPKAQNPQVLLIPPGHPVITPSAVGCVTPAPDGACSLSANDACDIEKEPDISIPNLLNLRGDGFDDHIELSWSTGISYPDQVVRFMYKVQNGVDYFDSPFTKPRDDGIVTTIAFPVGTILETWIRAETADGYGYWQRIIGLCNLDWNTDSELVYHFGNEVYHVNDFVIQETP